MIRVSLFSFILLLLSISCLVDARLLGTTTIILDTEETDAKDPKQNSKLVQMPLFPLSIIQDRRRRRRRRTLEDGEEEEEDVNSRSSSLYQGYGTHYVDLWIGTPSQRQTVIVDTGSSITAIPCNDCNNCGADEFHTDGLYNEDRSSSFEIVTKCEECALHGSCDTTSHDTPRCMKRSIYAEGSGWTAHEVIDRVCLGGPSHESAPLDDSDNLATDGVFGLLFGCQTQLTGLFLTQLADGIMGMDKSDAANSGRSRTFWKQAFDQKAIDRQAFSLCFGGGGRVTVQDLARGARAGVLTLGGSDTRLHQTPMVYAPDQSEKYPRLSEFYTVRLQKVYLIPSAEQPQPATAVAVDEGSLNGGGIIVDSGTTITELPIVLGKPFQDAFLTATGKEWTSPKMDLTQEEYGALPTIVFQIEGSAGNDAIQGGSSRLATTLDPTNPSNSILVYMSPSQYLELIKMPMAGDTKYTFEPLIAFNTNSNRNGILGANFMMGHDLLFDIDNKQLGFAESDCEYQTVMAAAATITIDSNETIIVDQNVDDVSNPVTVDQDMNVTAT